MGGAIPVAWATSAALTTPPSEPTPSKLDLPDDWDACDQMVGYLMLDALIEAAGSDRRFAPAHAAEPFRSSAPLSS